LRKTLLLVPLIAVALTASASAQTTTVPIDKIDPAKECASYGLEPGTEGYKGCVSALSDDNDPSLSKMRADADRQRSEMRAEMDRQNAAMRKQMDADMNAAQHPANGAPSNCVTTVNGTNTSTSCH
jgi:hypothetical protein